MRAIRLIAPGHALELQEIPIPVPNPDEVVVAVKAAGICHSDAHYRVGKSSVYPLPMTLGHEVAGSVHQLGDGVSMFNVGDRVCIHYMVTCGKCIYCNRGFEQFCTSGAMIGKYRDGGFADYICVPERSLFHLPDEIAYEHGAVMMCSSATSLHALRKANLHPGESVAVFGIGGLGMSAIQLACAMGSDQVFAVDINKEKLKLAEHYGAIPIDASAGDPVEKIKELTDFKGVDVALELIGLPETMEGAFKAIGIMGRVAIAGITTDKFSIDPYLDLINREAEIIGVSDHLAQEIPLLLEWARVGKLDISNIITKSVPLDADEVNKTLDQLENYGEDVRSVIIP